MPPPPSPPHVCVGACVSACMHLFYMRMRVCTCVCLCMWMCNKQCVQIYVYIQFLFKYVQVYDGAWLHGWKATHNAPNTKGWFNIDTETEDGQAQVSKHTGLCKHTLTRGSIRIYQAHCCKYWLWKNVSHICFLLNYSELHYYYKFCFPDIFRSEL